MLFNEPKLLKSICNFFANPTGVRFSALQRAEIAEIRTESEIVVHVVGFSALQRAEIAEMRRGGDGSGAAARFSALQRAEIAEMARQELDAEFLDEFQCSSTSRNC